jgi:hypothetical protein
MAVAVVASAHAAQVRKLRGWHITHITMTARMTDELTNPQDAVCGGAGETRIISASTVNTLDVHPTRMSLFAIYFPSAHRVLPYGDPGKVAQMTTKTTLTWGLQMESDSGCTVQRKTCSRTRTLKELFLFDAVPDRASRAIIWAQWKKWHYPLWDAFICKPPGVPTTSYVLEDLPRAAGTVHYRYAGRFCVDCDLDPLTKTRYATWMHAPKFHVRLSGSSRLVQRRGQPAVHGTYSYRADVTLHSFYFS